MSRRPAGRRVPPPLATRLLLAALSPDVRGRSIVGDLHEEWHARADGLGRDAWYWRTCLSLALRHGLLGRPARSRGAGRTTPPLDELRHAVRGAARSPFLTAVTVLALGVGVAAPTVMYSLLVAVTRPIPVPEPEALVHVGRRFTAAIVRVADAAWLRPLVEETSRGEGSLASVGAFAATQLDVSGDEGYAERRRAAAVTPGVFATLRVEPALGRGVTESDVAALAADPVVVISDALWRERFGSDPDVLGRTVRLDGAPHTVVGVMPRGFRFPDDTDLWRPLELPTAGGRAYAELVGRLSASGSVDALGQRVEALEEGLRASGELTDDRIALAAQPWSDRSVDANERRMLHAMVLVVSFILVIACANVVHVLLARALGRRRAIALRLALGAGRWRVVREQWLDAALLAGLGGAMGVGLAWLGVRALAAGMAHRLSWWMELRLDVEVLGFGLGLVTLAALVTGLAPALHAARLGAADALASGGGPRATGGRAATRVMGALVVAEVALACTLLVLGGLLGRGALRNLELTHGIETDAVLVAGYALRPDRYGGPDAIAAFHRALVESASARPEVAVAGVTSGLPGVFSPTAPVEIEGVAYERPDERPTTHVVHVTPGFLDALGVAPVRGRDLSWADGTHDAAVALVNEPFVRRYLRGADPLGTRIRVAARAGAEAGAWARIVGVVPGLGLDDGMDSDDTGIYLPIADRPPRSAHLLLRPRPGTTVAGLAPVARAVGASVDADVALTDVGSLQELVAATQDMERLFARLFGLFGLVGLALAGVGLYGLMAFSVGRRVRELGVRSALGARPGALVWTAIRGSTLQVGAGLALGLAAAAGVAPLLGSFFLGYDARDPVAYLTVAATLLLTGWLAALAPARRASAIDVAEVLRAE